MKRWLVERVRQWLVEKKRKQKPPAVVVVPSKVGRELDEDGAAGVGVEELVAAAEVAWKNKQIHMKLRQVTIECFNQGAPKDCSQLTRTNLDRSSRGQIDIPGACTWALGDGSVRRPMRHGRHQMEVSSKHFIRSLAAYIGDRPLPMASRSRPCRKSAGPPITRGIPGL